MFGEIKWTKVSAQYLDKYIELMDYFFSFIATNKIKIRIMFTQNYFRPINLTKEQKNKEFFLLYYQFLKAFGLQYCNDTDSLIGLKIYFDRLPDTKEKNEEFKRFIFNMQYQKNFQLANLYIKPENITEVTSHQHVLLQCMDVILGAMQFRLNNNHLKKPLGQRTRGKKTIAREKLYKFIYSKINETYPRFNIGMSTSLRGNIKNLWLHPYRHWKFTPSEYEIDKSKAKNK